MGCSDAYGKWPLQAKRQKAKKYSWCGKYHNGQKIRCFKEVVVEDLRLFGRRAYLFGFFLTKGEVIDIKC